jgi:solute carrier family 25 protein 39/40
MNEQKESKAFLWTKIVSGSVGSCITAFAVHPLEVIKVRRQAQSPTASSLPSNVTLCPSGCGTFVFKNALTGVNCLLPKSAVHYFDDSTGNIKDGLRINERGTIGTFRSILRKEGLIGLYAGITPTLTMGVPNTVIYFVIYDELSGRLSSSSSSSWNPAVAGATARFVASLSTAPLELLKTIQASRVGGGQQTRGMVAELQTIIKQEGVFALYKGLSPTLLRDVPFSAIYWVCIEMCRKKWRERRGQQSVVFLTAQQQASQALFNGTLSGLLAAAATTPLDVIKTRRQLQIDQIPTNCDHNGALVYRPLRIQGSLEMMQNIFNEEGVDGLWRGNVARMMKVAPACAIMISTYEVGKRLLTEAAS